MDTDGDGEADAIGLDTDNDGIIDALDADLDGQPDDPVPPGTGGTPNTGGGASTGGGMNGTGNATGSGGMAPGSGGTPPGGNGCASADIFCEDFEGVAAGSIPAGAEWTTRPAHCTSSGFDMGVSGDKPRGASTQALKNTNHSFPECRLSRSFDTLDEFWLTANIYWEPDVDFTNKEILAVDLHPASGLAKDDPAVRWDRGRRGHRL